MQYTVVGKEAVTADPNLRPDLVFATKDGYITVGTISDSEWIGFCDASEKPDLKNDSRFNTPTARSKNGTERILAMGEVLKERGSEEWLRRLDAHDVPCAPILRRSQIVDSEQVVARNLIVEFDQPTVGRVRQPIPAARFSGCDMRTLRPAPKLGEHTRDILRNIGYSDSEVDQMLEEKSVRM